MNTMGSEHQHKRCANTILAPNGPCVHLFEVVAPQVTDGSLCDQSEDQYWGRFLKLRPELHTLKPQRRQRDINDP